MSSGNREYELIVFGATGYTGKYCAEHIITHLPTDLKWAVAGRSTSKLSTMLEEIRCLNPDRLAPGLEISTLSTGDLDVLAKKTQLLINTVGPYHLYSTPVVEACVRNGTHYLDVTGEVPWVSDIIKKYHEMAKETNAIIIPQIGVESAPSDLLAFTLASLIREQLSADTKEVIATMYDIKSKPSGGTLATVLGILDHYGLRQIAESMKPFALSPVPHPQRAQPTSLFTKIFGIRSVSGLGTLTTSFAASTNRAIVHRTWGLLDGGNFYGQSFQYSEYLSVRNPFIGIALHFAVTLAAVALSLPPIRWLLKKFVYQPGQGQSKEIASRDYIEYRAIATPDSQESKQAFAKLSWNGSLYSLTGVLLAEAAMVILRDGTTADRLGGGCLTPAMLGQPFIDRLKAAGMTFETSLGREI